MIDIGSRYYDGRIVVQTNATVTIRRRFPNPTWRYEFHTWAEYDRLDLLAADYLDDHRLWWKIMDANPQILDPMNIDVGDQIRIPIAFLPGQAPVA